MRIDRTWPAWGMIVGASAALGWGVDCRTPPSHVQVRMGEDCKTCHQSDYLNASQPLHVGVLSENCGDCHGNTSWSPARGSNHSWSLEGAHSSTPCNSCHVGEPAVYEGTPKDCVSCHGAERDAVSEPSHVAFSDDCGSCHATNAWQPAAFQHPWPLEGAHASASCANCHGDPPTYANTPTTCNTCHTADLARATVPAHDGFSRDCGSCHDSFSWSSASFAHTQFPLTGAHQAAECSACHTGNPAVFAGTPSTCESCHAADLARVTAPPHDGFSRDCGSCHGTLSWGAADFAHTQFPLTGTHQTLECSACHTGMPAVFAGTPTDCVGCHQQDYANSPYPGHSSFPTTCQSCHSTTAWVPASGGNHPQNRFSITGRHNYPCNDCHNPSLGPNGAGNTDCVGCHDGAHTLSRMDSVHSGEVRNYPLGANRAPNFCLQCHPGGNGGG